MTAKTLGVTALLCLLAGAAGVTAPDQPLRVLSYGASGARVYVVPQTVAMSGGAGGSEVAEVSFRPRYYRGLTPLELPLPPGEYTVFVMQAAGWPLREATVKAGEYLWDGLCCHAVVADKKTSRWHYARGYQVEKRAGEVSTVVAAFVTSEPWPMGTYLPAGLPTRLTMADEAACALLEAEAVPGAWQRDVLSALRSGHKVLLRSAGRRLAVHADSPERIICQQAAGSGHWAGHRLSICTSP
jgi:hypothetical protein